MITQLNPHIPVVTPKGPGLAHFITDYGIEHDMLWTVFIDATGECWTYSNRHVRAQKNITANRGHITPYYDPDDVAFDRYDDYTSDDYESDDIESDIILDDLDRSLIEESREMYHETQDRLGQIEQQLQHQSKGLQNVYDTFNELEDRAREIEDQLYKLGDKHEKENIDEGHGKESRTCRNEKGRKTGQEDDGKDGTQKEVRCDSIDCYCGR